jgi:hypothetical protein
MKEKKNTSKARTWIKIMSILVLVTAIIGLLILSGGSSGLVLFIDQPSLYVIILFTITLLLFSNSFEDYILGIKIAASNPEYTTNELKAAINAFDLSIALVNLSALIGVLVGTISVLHSVSDFATFKVASAVVLLIVLYACIINLLQLSIRTRLRKELIYRG